MGIENLFEEKENASSERQPEFTVEAYQIARIKKGTVARCTREILDTILLSGCHGDAETAKRRALHKAKMLGNCFVVEKVERVVECFYQEDEVKINNEDVEI